MSLQAGNRLFLVVLIAVLFSSCTVKTKITDKWGMTYTVDSKGDALVKYEEPGRTITVDNRGRPGIIEQIFSAILMRGSSGDIKD